MQEFTAAVKDLLNSLYSPNSYLYRWLHGEDFSLEAPGESFPFWPVIGILCLLMLLCGVGFMIGGRFRRGMIAVLSGVFYATPLAVMLVCDPSNAIDNAAVATFLMAILWFFIGNCLLYRMNFFIRLIASYIHFLLMMFSGLIASDTSPAASLLTIWFIAVGFHLFVFIIPFLPGDGGDSGMSLNDMIGDEFDDYWAQDM